MIGIVLKQAITLLFFLLKIQIHVQQLVDLLDVVVVT